jgi:tetratricopeptide (TPR) repeat protein
MSFYRSISDVMKETRIESANADGQSKAPRDGFQRALDNIGPMIQSPRVRTVAAIISCGASVARFTGLQFIGPANPAFRCASLRSILGFTLPVRFADSIVGFVNRSRYLTSAFILALWFILFIGSNARAQTNTSLSFNLTEADAARFAKLRDEGYAALYNLDYETARKRFNDIVKDYPNHPAGPQLLASTLWAQTLNESRRLQATLYNKESFYVDKEDKPDPKLITEFRGLTKRASLLAKARLKANPKDVDAIYYLGAVEGLKAAFAVSVERKFLGALDNASSSVDRHREALKLDPTYRDAEITIGLYDYVVGSLPPLVKLGATLFGFRGSKKRGLATLERVAKEARWASDDAKSVLIVLYKREGRFADALVMCRDLAPKYPRNYLFKLEAADALVSLAAAARKADNKTEAERFEREAFEAFESLLSKDKATKETAARSIDLIHFRYGEALMTAERYEQAAKEFLSAANTQGANQTLATMAHLYTAQSLDLAGRRDEALKEYKIVLSRADVYDAHDLAKKGLKEPYKGNEKKAEE